MFVLPVHDYTGSRILPRAAVSPNRFLLVFRAADRITTVFRGCIPGHRGFLSLSILLSMMMAGVCRAEGQQVLCIDGDGHFDAHFDTGVNILVAAVRSGEFAAHRCGASLSWKDGDLVVTPEAAQVDIDVLGADPGFGAPVVAFQVRKADSDVRATYQIYALRNPRLLRTITGGDFYRAADADFDGRVAIWTADAAAADGFDGLAYADFDVPPVVAMRFQRGRLVDVSADYPEDYDRWIAGLRAHLDPKAASEFHASDSRPDRTLPQEQLARLKKTRVRILEIAWLYLYSGRQQKAWEELAQVWPPADLARVEAAVLQARKTGIDAQVDAVAPAPEHYHPRQHTTVYETQLANTSLRFQAQAIHLGNVVDILPREILLQRRTWPSSDETVDLMLDAAGKVWSIKTEIPDPELKEVAKGWKFIPAFKDGLPVACNYRVIIAPNR